MKHLIIWLNAFVLSVVVAFLIAMPFWLIGAGGWEIFHGSSRLGAGCSLVGLLVLRMMKPISILTGRDLKM